MQFTGRELSAILKIANAMVLADGLVAENEIKVMTIELMRFGVPDNLIQGLMSDANEMDTKDALIILASFDAERKKYVSSYLGTIMASDGVISEKELSLWRLVSSLCGFPEMTAAEAINNMASL